MSFAWNDAFRPARRVAQNNIHYEKACVLFNLASLASQQALQSDRTSAEGLTSACKLFQVRCAPGGAVPRAGLLKAWNQAWGSSHRLPKVQGVVSVPLQCCSWHLVASDTR